MNNNISKTVGFNINTLLIERGIKQKELAKFLEIPDNTISYFVKGTRTPNTAQIIEIAKFFDVSTDYILGLSNAKAADKDIQFISKVTGLSDYAIDRLAWYKESEIFKGSCISYTEIINKFIESKTIDDICEYIDEYACSIKKEKTLLIKMVGMFNNNDYPKSPEQFEMIDIEDSRDLSLFRIQEIIKHFTKEICSKTLEDIKSLNIVIEQKYNELHNKGE